MGSSKQFLRLSRTLLHLLRQNGIARSFATTVSMMRITFRVLAILAPLIAVVLAMPMAFGPFSGDPRGIGGPYLLTALPVWFAVLAAPGYLAALLVEQEKWSRSRLGRWWVVASLAVAALCSLTGVLASSMMFLFLPPSLLSLISTAVLLYRAIRTPKPGQA